jgi:5-methylcytosine-specific restriction protein A
MPTVNLVKRKVRDVTVNKRAYQGVYNTKRWKKLRAAKLSNNPLCEECLKKGIARPVDEIHHIRPFDINDIDYELAYDYDNLISLCYDCHKEAHAKLHRPPHFFPANAEFR